MCDVIGRPLCGSGCFSRTSCHTEMPNFMTWSLNNDVWDEVTEGTKQRFATILKTRARFLLVSHVGPFVGISQHSTDCLGRGVGANLGLVRRKCGRWEYFNLKRAEAERIRDEAAGKDQTSRIVDTRRHQACVHARDVVAPRHFDGYDEEVGGH